MSLRPPSPSRKQVREYQAFCGDRFPMTAALCLLRSVNGFDPWIVLRMLTVSAVLASRLGVEPNVATPDPRDSSGQRPV